MSISGYISSLGQESRSGFELRVRDLMGSADRAYAAATVCYGFQCRGCDESCCGERFYHYTLAEYLLLSIGLETLADEVRREVAARASDATVRIGRGEDRVYCPLHDDGGCLLYAYRPMICRLHGVPHVLRRPDLREQPGTGCHLFHEAGGQPESGHCRLDRTPLYAEMAALEIELRRTLGFSDRIRMTIADMVSDRFGD